MAQRGFTLVELALVAAIVGILGAAAANAYRQAVVRAQLAQQLVDIGHIRRVVDLETRSGRRDLQEGTRAGRAPPQLSGALPDREFNGDEGLRLQLVSVPPSALPPGGYGLAIDSTGSLDRLRLFRREIARAGFANIWLAENSFLMLLAVDPDDAGAAPGTPATSGAGAGDGRGQDKDKDDHRDNPHGNRDHHKQEERGEGRPR